MLICALFLLSHPGGNLQQAVWPWPILDRLIPTHYRESRVQEHWWLGIGAFLLVWAFDSYSTLQTPLRWNFSLYRGNLSFGIYVMHLLAIWTVWEHLLNPLRSSIFGDEMWSYVPFLVLNYGAVLWAADLFTRLDTCIVAIGRWTQKMFFIW
jgi:hypothetical protein